MAFLRSRLVIFIRLYFLLGSSYLRATNEDKKLDLELRLAPPGMNLSSEEPTQINDEVLSGSKQALPRSQKELVHQSSKRKRGRPELNLTEEQKAERKRKITKIYNQKYDENLKKDPKRYGKFLKRRRERTACLRKKQLQDPKRKAEIIEMRKKHKRTYHAKRKLKKLNAHLDTQE
ncbi:uncharacterized protein FA14DRAFT_155559 [Meira miltonrushii]|uniref:Uncharacterized protein n=1 Tax=Meira miltonrushii TaxID=1280837 RepID=A0A316VEV2_9BASI|nr:uncharacterized protein FA14DRAFT_155559 [Meira miltonrushii]PWN36157.1 hypothetical protein FA14DRAFT_155559 [Meira miltonrushii]